ncbi:hypothetical protein OSB04_016913 [Centaurea solstitialis]|uniref:Reverse transcriptase domain-containing protein n=1 Tax=Centaurea solstitialis TaxID=347529 RepID=A0AA38T1X1_9ASTR|nr:hypothetical protein OSB04_016913 [Centaurea solstitialis]
MVNLVRHFEKKGEFSRGCNPSFISLFLKVKDHLTLKEFRPISLIDCVYKIIAKLLAFRLKKVMGKVASEEQSQYIEGRQILDGPLMLNEVRSWAKRLKNRVFLFKVDFEKAFDSLNWSYLDSVLEQMDLALSEDLGLGDITKKIVKIGSRDAATSRDARGFILRVMLSDWWAAVVRSPALAGDSLNTAAVVDRPRRQRSVSEAICGFGAAIAAKVGVEWRSAVAHHTDDKDMVNLVRHFEKKGKCSRGCNPSFISLFPKVKDPLTLKELRPISLIDCVYKIIAKLLACHLKKVMGKVVSEEQSEYIEGRQILDGPLMLNEVRSWAKRSKNRGFLFKVDFEKAFDSLSWSYHDSVLEQMDFSIKWRSWIRGCVISARSSVLVNRSSTSEFPLTRGVRQGYPLSPFLFILAMEVTQRRFSERIDKRQIRKDKRITEKIGKIGSGDAATSRGANKGLVARGASYFVLLCPRAVDMATYIFARSAMVVDCRYAVSEETGESYSDSNWRSVDLEDEYDEEPQYVLWINYYILKMMNIQEDDEHYRFGKLCKSKVCGIGVRDDEICWVNWSTLIAPKKLGGLGVGSIKAANISILIKWWWRLRNESHSLWAKVIYAIHGAYGRDFASLAHPKKVGVWLNIAKAGDTLETLNISIDDIFHEICG